MNLPKYSYRTNDSFLDYEFESIGPRGNVKKVVRFSQIRPGIFNLAFGDLDEKTGEISDTIITNNNDSKKVLATVAATVNDFTLHYPDASIIAKGSTHSRTRLYRMGITNNWQQIAADFEIQGLNKDKKWEIFKHGSDYDAFWVRRK